MNINYQQLTDKEIEKIQLENSCPSLLLHSCCGPCSSYVLEYLAKYFKITVLFYNPNIYPENEYDKRLKEQIRLVNEAEYINKVEVKHVPYEYTQFLSVISGLEEEKEGGARCAECFKLRLEKTAKIAKEEGFAYFASTLTVSPHKNVKLLNQIGLEMAGKYNVKYLVSDFKKKNGYKRSTELSVEYNLYRQNYCGCQFSLWED